MDKTGRFLKFDKNGQFIEICAKIDDYIGNGFTLKNGEEEAVIACSGIVLDEVFFFNLFFLKNGGRVVGYKFKK